MHSICPPGNSRFKPIYPITYKPDENLTVEHRGQFQPGKVTNYKISLNILITQDIF